MEFDIVNAVIGILIGIGLGMGTVVLYIWWTIHRFHSNLNNMIRDTLEEVKTSLVGLVIEEDGGQLYAYRDSDCQFLCQGIDIAEIHSKFQEQYPEKIAFLAGGDPVLVERLKNELKALKEQENNESSISV